METPHIILRENPGLQHLVTVVPSLAPFNVRQGHEAGADRLKNLWGTHIRAPRGNDTGGDYEDFFEQAARLDAAIDGFGLENVWLRIGRFHETTARNLATCELRPLSALSQLPKYGPQEGQPGHHIEAPQAALAGDYAAYKAFQSRSGRRSVLAGFRTGDEQDLKEVLWDMYTAGVRDFFVKTTAAKLGLWEFSAGEGLTPVQLEEILLGMADWTIVRREGDRDFLQVQDRVLMEYEYRLFIVNGEIVTGAGCIEEFTPLDNRGEPFSPYLRRSRSEHGPIVSDNSRVKTMLNFAQEAVAALTAEIPGLHDYTLDVAIGADGNPLIIELNDLLNSGLYASNPTLVTRAMARRELTE